MSREERDPPDWAVRRSYLNFARVLTRCNGWKPGRGAKTGKSNLCWNRKEKEEEIERRSLEKRFLCKG